MWLQNKSKSALISTKPLLNLFLKPKNLIITQMREGALNRSWRGRLSMVMPSSTGKACQTSRSQQQKSCQVSGILHIKYSKNRIWFGCAIWHGHPVSHGTSSPYYLVLGAHAKVLQVLYYFSHNFCACWPDLTSCLSRVILQGFLS